MDKTKDIKRIGSETKTAWLKNWQPHETERLLEIFSYPRVRKQISLFTRYLPKDERILEGGCGLGPYLIYLRKNGYNVIGIDYNEEPLKKIKAYEYSSPVSVMDVRNTFFKDKVFGGYLSLGVIEHFPEGPQLAIKEARRILKNGGIFIIQVPVMNIFLALRYPIELLKRSRLIRRIFKKEQKDYYWQCYFKKKNLMHILKENGFEVLEVRPMDHEHSLISFTGLLRDKASYDGANRAGVVLSEFCEKHLAWFTAANMVLVCRKKAK